MTSPGDYPSRKPFPIGNDKFDAKGKGPIGQDVLGGIAPVDTTGFVHRQDMAPNAGGTPSVPNNGTEA